MNRVTQPVPPPTDKPPGADASGAAHPIQRLGITLATGALPGLIAGFVAGGIGSRVAMRVMAVTSSPQATGAETDFGATVGDITFGGTVALLLIGTIIGVFGGMLYLGVKRWLPGRGWIKGLAFGGLLLAVFGRLIIDPSNEDFVILEPAGLAVAMFASLFLIYGLMFVPLYERLEPIVRRPRSSTRSWLLLIPVVIPLLAGGLFGIAFLLVVAAVATTLSTMDRSWWASPRLDIGGRIALIAIAAYGASVVLRATVDIV